MRESQARQLFERLDAEMKSSNNYYHGSYDFIMQQEVSHIHFDANDAVLKVSSNLYERARPTAHRVLMPYTPSISDDAACKAIISHFTMILAL